MSWDALLAERRHREQQGRWRTLGDLHAAGPGEVQGDSVRLHDFASNDYLGLAARPWQGARLAEALAGLPADLAALLRGALTRHGAGAARLISGNHPLYAQLEEMIAALHGCESALVFGSGYAANLGTLAALLGPDDAVFSDALNHASIIDGCRLSGARRHVYRHGDLGHLAALLAAHPARRRLIVTDTVFSMDGTLAPLSGLAALARQHGAWLMVDEAHAGGVLGPQGAGLAAQLGVRPDIQLGTLSKGYGAVGAYVAGDRLLTEHLLNAARSQVFSTALPPAALAAAWLNVRASLSLDPQRAALARQAAALRQRLTTAGYDLAGSASQIVPLVVGDEAAALALAARLRQAGYAAVAIRPPTVAAGTARVRLTLTAAQPAGVVRALGDLLTDVLSPASSMGRQPAGRPPVGR